MIIRRSIGFKIAAAFIEGLAGIFWSFKGISDLFGRVPGRLNNLIVAIVLFILGYLGWRWSLWGGIAAATLGVILAVYFNLNLPDIYSAFIPMFLICAPMVLSGLLFIEADWSSRKRN